MQRDSISVRFRKSLDADLREATVNMPDGVLSDMARNGLRLMLGIRTTKTVTVLEQPLSIPVMSKPINHSISAPDEPLGRSVKPTVFSPKKNVGGDV